MTTRHRHFELVLYADNDIHLDFIINTLPLYTNIHILHDKDLSDIGELLKPHYHIIISFDTNRTLSAVQKELNIIEPTLINVIKSLQAYVRYLLHLDTPHKYQYPMEAINGNNIEKLSKYFKTNLTESNEVIEILNIIEDMKNNSLKDIVSEIANRNLWSVFRRGGIIFIKIIESNQLKVINILKR